MIRIPSFALPELNDPRLEAEGFHNVDWKSTFFSVIPALIVTWIPFSNGMTDAVRHLEAGPGSSPGQALRRHDEPSLRLKPVLSTIEGARDFNHPQERH